MNRLPAKTKGPIRVDVSDHVIDNVPARLDAGGVNACVAQSLDRVLTLKLLRFPTVRERTGLSRSTIWRLERCGDFPKHRRISANVVAWVEEEVMGVDSLQDRRRRSVTHVHAGRRWQNVAPRPRLATLIVLGLLMCTLQ